MLLPAMVRDGTSKLGLCLGNTVPQAPDLLAALLLLFTYAVWVYYPSQPVASTPPTKVVSLVIEHEPVFLPLPIPSDKQLSILSLHPKIDAWGFVGGLNNVDDKSRSWPSKGVLNSSKVPELSYKCVLHNYGETALLNVLLEFKPNFRERNADGSVGAVVLSQNREAAVGAIDRGAVFIFYVVNESPLFVDVTMPQTAVVQLPGEHDRREISLVPEKRNVLDVIPLIFPPSSKKWSGIPK